MERTILETEKGYLKKFAKSTLVSFNFENKIYLIEFSHSTLYLEVFMVSRVIMWRVKCQITASTWIRHFDNAWVAVFKVEFISI